jgi:hypothetical protein
MHGAGDTGFKAARILAVPTLHGKGQRPLLFDQQPGHGPRILLTKGLYDLF